MDCRAGIIPCSTGNGLAAQPTTGFSWQLKRAIHASPKPGCATCSNKAAGSTSRLCTRNNMLRGFILISLLFTIAIVAVFGFRGQKSTGSPLEIFPDMVRQMKVRSQAPLNFFADGRGARSPVAGTVPIGYEMPKAETIATPVSVAATAEPPQTHPRVGF